MATAKEVIGFIGILGGLSVALASIDATQAPAPQPAPAHGCSAEMNATLAMRSDGDRYRKAFCDEGGEARAEQMVKGLNDERANSKAF